MTQSSPRCWFRTLVFLSAASVFGSSSWSQPSAPVFHEAFNLADPTPDPTSWYGFAVATANGIAAIGDPRGLSDDGYTTGSVHVFDVSDPANPAYLSEFTADVPDRVFAFPHQMDFDWPLLAAGTISGGPPTPNGRFAGAVFVFDLSDPEHPVQHSVSIPPADLLDDIGFGSDVAIDGDLLAVTGFGPYDTSPGSYDLVGVVYLFDAQTGELLSIIDPGPGVGYYGFLGDLALDNGLLCVGAHGPNSRGGQVHLYDVTNPITPVWRSTITGDDIGSILLGFSVDLDGDDLVASDPYWRADIDHPHIGRAFAFDVHNPAAPVLVATLVQDQPRDYDLFGFGVGIDNGTIVVCCAEEPLLGSDGPTAETAYIYDLSAADPAQPTARVRANPGAPELASFLITPLRLADGVAVSNAHGDAAVAFAVALPCGPADLSTPRGELDMHDITEFISRFEADDSIADLDASGVFDLADIVTFVQGFADGCVD